MLFMATAKHTLAPTWCPNSLCWLAIGMWCSSAQSLLLDRGVGFTLWFQYWGSFFRFNPASLTVFRRVSNKRIISGLIDWHYQHLKSESWCKASVCSFIFQNLLLAVGTERQFFEEFHGVKSHLLIFEISIIWNLFCKNTNIFIYNLFQDQILVIRPRDMNWSMLKTKTYF